MTARLYRPRSLLRMTVPLPKNGDNEPFTFDVPVLRSRHVSDDHNHADTLNVDLDWVDSGVDPRWISGATAEFYLGTADEFHAWEPSDENLRFVGRMVRPMRQCQGESLRVECEFHDYTSFFLLTRQVETAGIPRYSDTLSEAWARLCSVVPDVEQLADNLVLRGLDSEPRIGDAVAERFRKAGKLHVEPGKDAWAIWQQCVGSLGLISFMEKDHVVVTTETDYYTAAAPPQLIWGRNLLDFTEQRNNDRAARGFGITSFDPITGRALEAVFDPLAGKRGAKRVGAKRRGKPAQLNASKDVDFFVYPGITDPDKLQALAKRGYEERSRQELEGTLATVDMTAETSEVSDFDLLSLKSGDTIDVRFLDSDDAAFAKQFDSRSDRIAYLLDRGYSEKVATIIAANADRLTEKSNLMYVKKATTELESRPDGGSFRLNIEYCNKIDLSGGTGPRDGL